MNKVLIFGGTGGIGDGAKQAFESENAQVICLGHKDLDFQKASHIDISHKISEIDPDVIVHCAGTMGIDSYQYHATFDVNFGSVWKLINHYWIEIQCESLTPKKQKPISIVIVGSSAYNKASPNYVLYAASKAATVSMVSSMMPKFVGTQIRLNLLNPGKTNTPMRRNAVGKEPEAQLLTPYEVGREIVRISKMESGNIIRLDKNG